MVEPPAPARGSARSRAGSSTSRAPGAPLACWPSAAPDVVHAQWLGLAAYDARWLREVARTRPTILTAHDVFPRRRWNAQRLGDGLGIRGSRRRPLGPRGRAARAAGVARERLVASAHAVFDSAPDAEPGEPAGRTLLFFGLIRAYKGLDVLCARCPRSPPAAPGTRLVVAGHPFEPVEPLQALARELGVADARRVAARLRPRRRRARRSSRRPRSSSARTGSSTRRACSRPRSATAVPRSSPTSARSARSCASSAPGASVAPEDPGALAAACAELLTDRRTRSPSRGAGARAARADAHLGRRRRRARAALRDRPRGAGMNGRPVQAAVKRVLDPVLVGASARPALAGLPGRDARRPARLGPADLLRASARRTGREAVPDDQVPHDGSRRDRARPAS